MRHAILGPGGVGGLVGTVLSAAGEDVTVVVRPGTEQHYPREFSLESPFGTIQTPVRVTAKLTTPIDVLWITVKATQLDEALESTPPHVRIDTVVPLLNGIDHVERLRQWFGHERVIPATIAVESERIAPGKTVHRSPFVRLNLAASGNIVIAKAVDEFSRFGFECKFVGDERVLLWNKLAFLAPVALTTAAARCPIGEVIKDPNRSSSLSDCVQEGCAVACAAGASIDAHAIMGAIRALPFGMRSSMEKDLSSGRLPEIDAIGGPILRGGATHGIPVPATSTLVRAITRS